MLMHVWDCDGTSVGADGTDIPCSNCEVYVPEESDVAALNAIRQAYANQAEWTSVSMGDDGIIVTSTDDYGVSTYRYTYRGQYPDRKYYGEDGPGWYDF